MMVIIEVAMDVAATVPLKMVGLVQALEESALTFAVMVEL